MTSMDTTEPVATDVVTAVKAATANTGQRPIRTGFSLTTAGTGEWIMAAFLGLYLGYAVVRLPEVFPEFAVPRLPLVLMLVMLTSLTLIVPQDAWAVIWRRSKALRLTTALIGIACVTAPIGIWPSESLLFLRTNFSVPIAVFLCCLVLLRDRRVFRLAVAIFVLCVGAVSANVLRTYDPEAPVFNEEGDWVNEETLAARPELRRLRVVGVGLDANDFGAILATTFPLALWLSVGNFRRRVFWSAVAGLFVVTLVPTQSRGSMLGILAAATVLIGVGARGWRRWFTILLLGGGAAIFVIMATGIGAGDRFTDFSGDDYNLTNNGRWYFWRQGFIWMLKRPWGYGITNYTTYFGILNGEERAAHSIWVQYGMELGVLGLVTFTFLCWTLIQGLRRLRRAAFLQRGVVPTADAEEVLAGHMLAVMAGALVTGSFLSNAYYPLTYMTMGLCAAVLLGTPIAIDEPVAASAPPDSPGRGALPRRRIRPLQPPQPGA